MADTDVETELGLWDEHKVERELILPHGSLAKERIVGIGVGTLPYIKLSAKRIRYRAADVIAFIEARTVVPESSRPAATPD